MNDLTKLINQLVDEKTFTLDGLDAIKAVRDKADALVVELETTKERLKNSRADESNLREALDKERELTKLLQSKIDMHLAREKEADIAIYAADKYQAVADAYKDAMSIVFKPNAVRETISKSVPVGVGGGGTMSGFVSSGSEVGSVTKEDI